MVERSGRGSRAGCRVAPQGRKGNLSEEVDTNAVIAAVLRSVHILRLL